jgi:hypothetical protein
MATQVPRAGLSLCDHLVSASNTGQSWRAFQ